MELDSVKVLQVKESEQVQKEVELEIQEDLAVLLVQAGDLVWVTLDQGLEVVLGVECDWDVKDLLLFYLTNIHLEDHPKCLNHQVDM